MNVERLWQNGNTKNDLGIAPKNITISREIALVSMKTTWNLNLSQIGLIGNVKADGKFSKLVETSSTMIMEPGVYFEG